MIKKVVWLLSLFYIFGLVYSLSLDLGSPCATPNGEQATCTLVNSCEVIKIALLQPNEAAIRFARLSHCGYLAGKGHLVCCGSTAFFETHFNKSNNDDNNNNSKLPDRKICGKQKVRRRHDRELRRRSNSHAHGGKITGIDEHPWAALLSYLEGDNSSFKCGGTLINKRYVLTAAHCVKTSGLVLDSVRLGEWQISTKDDCDSSKTDCANPVINVKIEKTIVHPQYKKSTASNDIALLRLARNVEYSDYIRPICLPSPDDESPSVGAILTVVGWGATENSSSSDYKLKLDVPVVDLQTCTLKLGGHRPITENQLCAGGVKGRDSCDGDSGGPLVRAARVSYDREQGYLEGIVSWGIGCALPGYYGVYTRVSKYINWITDNIAE